MRHYKNPLKDVEARLLEGVYLYLNSQVSHLQLPPEYGI